MHRLGAVLMVAVVFALCLLVPLQAVGQPYTPSTQGRATVVLEAPPAAPAAAGQFPFTGGDLMLLSMGIGLTLTAAGFGGKYMIHRRKR